MSLITPITDIDGDKDIDFVVFVADDPNNYSHFPNLPSGYENNSSVVEFLTIFKMMENLNYKQLYHMLKVEINSTIMVELSVMLIKMEILI